MKMASAAAPYRWPVLEGGAAFGGVLGGVGHQAHCLVESVGRAALADIHRVLGSLRSAQKAELAPSPGIDELPQRFITLLARGLCNSESEHHLHLSRGTVKTHIGRLLAKLDARDRAQLVIVGYETGLVGTAPA